jgi:alpha,alpha-trehalase
VKGYVDALSTLERVHGVVACRWEKGKFQWAEPNSWAPLNYVAVAAAHRLGLQEIAKRLTDKYLAVTEKIYQKTQRLWEKYNAETGALDVASEYGTPEMLGWTAGVYTAFYHYRENGYKQLI